MATGEYESGTARVIKSLLAPGDVFADIGAHIGFFSVLAAGCVGAGGRVLSFEPAPRTRERLNQNIALNRLTNVTVFEEALGGQSAQTSLSIGPVDDTGLASLRGVLDADQCVDVRVRTFDGVFSSSERLAGVKIDVEGAEAKVLTGMSEQLRRHHPWVIAEITDSFLAEMGDSAEGLFSAMDRLGYEPYLLTDDEPSPIAVGRPLCDLPRQFNALFLPPGGDGRIRVERGFRSPKVF
jgi:FkbM family methyltransferase